MARTADGKSALIEVKAVDDCLSALRRGRRCLEPDDAGPPGACPASCWSSATLLDRLGLEVGSPLTIGEASVTIGGVLGAAARPARRPPRLWTEAADVARDAGAHRAGAARQPHPLDLSREAPRGSRRRQGGAQGRARTASRAKFPQSGFAIRDWTDPAPSLRRDADRFTQFVSFVGLTALLLGGIGVGNAIQSYMAKKREIIATFKCLGAPSRLVLAVYFLQALLLALGRHRDRARHRRAHRRRSSPRSMPMRCRSRSPSSRIRCRSSPRPSPASSPWCCSCSGRSAAPQASRPRCSCAPISARSASARLGLMRWDPRRPAWRCSRSPSRLPRSAPSPPRSPSASCSPFSSSPASACWCSATRQDSAAPSPLRSGSRSPASADRDRSPAPSRCRSASGSGCSSRWR